MREVKSEAPVRWAWPPGGGVESAWQALAGEVLGWLEAQDLPARDAIVLLPFAQHLALARRAFAAHGPWPPRLETTRSLASALGPASLPLGEQMTGDAALDALQAAALVARHTPGAADPRLQRLQAAQVLELAQALQRAAHAQAPHARAAFWARVDAQWAGGATDEPESHLARAAAQWARLGPTPATDALWQLRPRAWVLIEVGQPDPLARALLADSGLPCLHWMVDAGDASEARGADWRVQTLPEAAELATAAAAQVLRLLEDERGPVLVPAVDRALVRQVLAVLAPNSLNIQDETGVSFATQGPAAALRHLVRGAIDGVLDDALAWAKSPLSPLTETAQGEVDALERWARRHRCTAWRGSPPEGAPTNAWLALTQAALPLSRGAARRPLSVWILALKQVLQNSQALDASRWPEAWQPTWRALLEALWIGRQPWPGSAAARRLEQPLRGAEWLAWVDAALQAAVPAPERRGPVHVVVTPLNRAMLRPFGAVVLAGADAGRWALGRGSPALVSPAVASALGLPTKDAAQALQWQALLHLARLPHGVCLHARHQDGVDLEWAPALQRLRAQSAPWRAADEARVAVSVSPQPCGRAEVALPGWLPTRWSASQVAALRECPYQFFARVRLGLDESPELDRDPDARDWGRWLHAVLERAHALGDVDAQWDTACQQVLETEGVPPDERWPFLALLQRWGPAYQVWWQKEAAQGRMPAASEAALAGEVWADDPLLGRVAWVGRADRIDVLGNASRQLLDFKTSSVDRLRDRAAQDPQLPFYAALLAHLDQPVAQAAYLGYEHRTRGLKLVPSRPLPHAAEQLRDGLATDLRQLHAGQPLPALGEGQACEHCVARGLCRRDDWSAP
jgi:ATP-dependent helicase/nuclease subunit B